MGLSVVFFVNKLRLTFTANSPAPTEASAGSAVADDLPPFAQLANDEDRERKAERSNPGTYHVVVNPDSFQHLPEYSDDEAAKRKLSPLRRGSIAPSLASSFGKDSSVEGVPLYGDPNVVVLPRFEDVTRRAGKDPKSPTSPSLRRVKTEEEDSRPSSEAGQEATDEKYARQFRDVVWRQLVPAEIDMLDGMERSSALIVENEARFFSPVCYKPFS
jgi:hypothetical protein